MGRRDDRDWFAEDVEPLFRPRVAADEPIPYRLIDQAEAVDQRPASRRCASPVFYRNLHGGAS